MTHSSNMDHEARKWSTGKTVAIVCLSVVGGAVGLLGLLIVASLVAISTIGSEANARFQEIERQLGSTGESDFELEELLARRDADSDSTGVATQEIMIAAHDIRRGEPIDARVLKLEKWPRDRMPEGAISQLEDIEGRHASVNLYAGQPILKEMLRSDGDEALATRIPNGYRVVSVKAQSSSGGLGLISPGDDVDVFVCLSRDAAASESKSIVKNVLQDIRVMAIDPSTDTVSLLVKPDEGQRLVLAVELGQIRLMLRNPDDDMDLDSESGKVSVEHLFNAQG